MTPWLVLVPIGVLVGFLAFVWQRLAVAPGWRPRWVRYAVALVLVALTALTLAGFDVWGGWFTPAQLRPAVWVGQAFMATCLYLFLGLVPVWLVCVGIWLVRRQHEHGRVGRQRLNRVASPLVAVAAVAITAYGAVEAAHPSITRFEVASPQLPAEFDGVRVGLITDLHAGAVRSASFTRQVVDLVNAEHPDLVVIAGDTVDGTAARYAPEIAPLAYLEAPLLRRLHTYIWFYSGSTDSLHLQNAAFARELTALAIPHRYRLVYGGHNWALWRDNAKLAYRAAATRLAQ